MRNMYFSEEDIKRIKENNSPDFVAMLKKVLKKTEEALLTEVLTEDKVSCENGRSGNQHENYYDASKPFQENMLFLGFGYYYFNDKRYFEKARELLLTYAEYKKWHGKGWRGRSELNTAHFCCGMALGCDLFSHLLTKEEKAKITKATTALGILPTVEDWLLPGKKIHALDTMGHNWWIYCVSFAGLAAAILSDVDENLTKYAQLCADGAKEWFSYPGNPINIKPENIANGGYYESWTYYDFALSAYSFFRRSFKYKYNRYPFDDMDIFKKAAVFFANVTIPSSKRNCMVVFGDATHNNTATSLLYLLGDGLDSPEARWHIKNTTNRDAELVDILFYSDIYEKEAYPPKNTSAAYDSIGWAVLRDSFEKDSPALAIKCGDTWNHAHADAGHFSFYNSGYELAYDSGSCDYGLEKYVTYYWQSVAHNVLLFNGKGQYEGDGFDHVRMRGQLYNFTEQDGFKYIVADATGPMSRYFRQHLRHFLWLSDFILIYDDAESYEQGTVDFLLHAESSFNFSMLTPCEVSEIDGYKDHQPDEIVKTKVFSQKTDENRKTKFIFAIPLKENVNITLENVENGYIVKSDNDTVYINTLTDRRIMHHNCINTIDNYTTDAIMVTKSHGKYGIVNGSILRKDGAVILDTLKRMTGLVK